jgi:hypothetical protein
LTPSKMLAVLSIQTGVDVRSMVRVHLEFASVLPRLIRESLTPRQILS